MLIFLIVLFYNHYFYHLKITELLNDWMKKYPAKVIHSGYTPNYSGIYEQVGALA